MTDLRELLPLYALGVLDHEEAQRVERAVASDPTLAAELATLEASALTLVEPVAPAPEVEARLLAAIGAGRFARFGDRLASLFDVSVERARELVGLIERTASWEAGVPGVDLVHFSGGPAHAAADCGFIRLAPGAAFPLHEHLGEEVSLVLTGQLRDRSGGRVYGPGDELVAGVGAPHDVVCDGDVPCIYAARVTNGISIAGTPVRPPKK